MDTENKATPQAQEPAAEPTPQAQPPGKPEGRPEAIETPVTRTLSRLLERARLAQDKPEAFGTYQRVLATLGVWSLLAGAALFFLAALVMGLRPVSAGMLMTAVAGLVVFAGLHYAAGKFAMAGPLLLRSHPGRMPASVIMDCLALLALAGAATSLLDGARAAIVLRTLQPLWPSLIAFSVMLHLSIVCTNPRMCLNIEKPPEGTSVCEMALALIMLVPRMALALAPILLGYGLLATTFWMLGAVLHSWTDRDTFRAVETVSGVMAAIALAPLAFYLAYLLIALIVGLCTAVLSGRRDALAPEAKS